MRLRIGLLVLAIAEAPVLLWAVTVMDVDASVVLTLAGLLTLVLLVAFVVRRSAFLVASLWLLAIGAGAWYLVGFLSPSMAFGLAATFSTIVFAVLWPVVIRAVRLPVHRRNTLR